MFYLAFDFASACNQASLSYTSASWDYDATTYSVKTTVETVDYTTTLYSKRIYDCSRPCGTGLGAICYAGPVTTNISVSHVSSTSTATYTIWEPYPSPKPNCTIRSSDCLSLISSYSSYYDRYWDDPGRSTLTRPTYPACSATAACTRTACTFQHGGMSLYFWPVTTNVSRDMCAWEPKTSPATATFTANSTYIPTTTGAYAVVDGVTMFQGNVYMSLMEPWVVDNCRNSVSRVSNKPNILTIASTDLYSVRKYPNNLIPWSVDYADFQEPVPWSAYIGDRYCAQNRPLCSEVFPNDYHPVMIMPPEIAQLDPAWKDCAFDKYGIFDPPIALRSVGNIFPTSTSRGGGPVTSATAVPQSTPPTPGQSGSNGNPTPTASPRPTPGDPSSSKPPTNNPPSSNTPTNNPPVNTPPVNSPPANSPPANSPPVNNPPANSPPANNPPGNNPPANNPPGNNPPANNPNPGQSNPPLPGPTPPSQNNPNPAPPVITVGPSVIPIDPTGGLVINPGTTLTPGGPAITTGGTTLSLGNNGLQIIAPGTSTQIPFGSSAVPVTLGDGTTVTIDPNAGLIVGGTTLRQGDPALTVSGTTMSIGPSGLVIVDPSGTSTVPIPSGTGSNSVITVGGSTFTMSNGAVVLGPGTTLQSGDPARTISGTTLSIGPSGLVIMDPSTTRTVPVPSTSLITVGNSVFTVGPNGLVLGPGTTLKSGDPAVTVSGTTYSIGPNGLVVVEPSTTRTVPVKTGGGSGSSSTPAASPTGSGSKSRIDWRHVLGMSIGMMALFVL